MNAPKSKITAQGQISIPADVRKKLGVGPGSTLEWVENNGEFTVRRVTATTWDDVHKAAFPHGPPKYVADPRKEGIAAYVRRRYGKSGNVGD